MKKLIFIFCLFLSLGASAQRIYKVEGQPQRFVNALGIPVMPASYYNNSSDTALIFFDRNDTTTISFKFKGLVKKLAGSRLPWDSLTGIPANFSTTYALSNDVKDSIQKRLAVTLTSPATGNLIRFNGSEWVNWIPNYLSFTDSSTILGGRWLPNRSADSIAVIRALANSKGIGTVTSISAGTGMNFTTITGTGTVNADTTVLSTKANVTGLLTGYATTGSLATKLNISDTAAMLTPFIQYSDTTGLYSQVVRTFGTQTIGGTKTFDGTLLATNAIVSTRNAGVQVPLFFPQMLTSALNDSSVVMLGRSGISGGTPYNIFDFTMYQKVANQSTGAISLNVTDFGAKKRIQYWDRDSVFIGRPTRLEGNLIVTSNSAIGSTVVDNSRLFIRNENASNSPVLTLYKNIFDTEAEDILRIQAFQNGVGARTVAQIRANGSAYFRGTVVFSASTATSIDGSDGRIITDKFRIYNSVPATQYHDFTSAATVNRSIAIPDASGTMALRGDSSIFYDKVVRTFGTQTIGGTKTFSGNVTMDNALTVGTYEGGPNLQVNTDGTGSLANTNVTWDGAGNMVFKNTTAFTRSNLNTGVGYYFGLPQFGGGTSVFFKTSSVFAGGTDYAHGLAIDGSYAAGNSTTNIRTLGTNTTGGYASSLNFWLDNNGTQRLHTSFNNDRSTTFFGQLRATVNNADIAAGQFHSLGWNGIAGFSVNLVSSSAYPFIHYIMPNGHVGIGIGSPSVPLDVTLPSGSNGIVVKLSRSQGAYTWGLGVDVTNSNFNFYNNGGTSVANINNSTGAYTATSDSSAKINITDAFEALPLLDSIKIRQYDWKGSNVHEPYGIIAQELYKVTPTYVSVPSDSTGRWGIQKAELVPMLIKGIQEQNKKISALEARLQQLEAILNKQ